MIETIAIIAICLAIAYLFRWSFKREKPKYVPPQFRDVAPRRPPPPMPTVHLTRGNRLDEINRLRRLRGRAPMDALVYQQARKQAPDDHTLEYFLLYNVSLMQPAQAHIDNGDGTGQGGTFGGAGASGDWDACSKAINDRVADHAAMVDPASPTMYDSSSSPPDTPTCAPSVDTSSTFDSGGTQ